MPKPFKLALCQMRVVGGDKRRNVARAVEAIAEAAARGADMALLPECLDLGWTHPSSLTQAEAIPHGGPCGALAEAARAHRIHVCAGLTERDGDRVYNAAVILDRSGALLRKHRKLNELDIGHRFYGQGDSLAVVETEFGALGLLICADASAKNLTVARSLGYMGADVLLSPSAWAVPADHDNARDPYGEPWRSAYGAVAREFSMAVFGVSNVGPIDDGPWAGRKCIGCSLAVDAAGREILQGPYGEDAESLIVVDVVPAPRPARGTGWDGRP